jgi:virulence-associated protein VapD
MEFAGIYGTHQGMQIPIEIGVVIHQPDTDRLSFVGKAFNRNIDVELWKNITDDVGKRIEGKRRVFNLAFPAHTKSFDKTFHLDTNGRKEARRAIAAVYQDLREFMHALNHKDISTLVFFARSREMEAFGHSRVKTDDFLIRDLQDEVRSCFHLKEHVSLDRVSLITQFGITKSTISSVHFSYTLPEKFRYLIKPHKAIGDAARIFLVDLEFHRYKERFGEHLTGHIEEYERRKMAELPARDSGSGQS